MCFAGVVGVQDMLNTDGAVFLAKITLLDEPVLCPRCTLYLEVTRTATVSRRARSMLVGADCRLPHATQDDTAPEPIFKARLRHDEEAA